MSDIMKRRKKRGRRAGWDDEWTVRFESVNRPHRHTHTHFDTDATLAWAGGLRREKTDWV